MGGSRWRGRVLAAVAAAALLAPLAFAGGCGSSGGVAASPSASSAAVSKQQVTDLVDLTCAEIARDAAATLTAIDAGDAPFVDTLRPELYAFVYDREVRLVATPDAGVRGQSMKGKPDALGTMFRDEIVAGALDGGDGWVTYVYKEPAKEGLFEKATYYRLAQGSDGRQYVVCAGRYVGPFAGTPQASPAAAVAPTQGEVQAFVKKAVAYAEAHGKKATLEAFTLPGGEFHQGQLYIYAYDFDGTVIAHGGNAKLVGQDLLGMTDPNGVKVIQELVRLAKGGGGWLHYTWPNPANDNQQESKLGYVLKIDDGWFLGSGTYGAAASAPPSKAEVRAFVDEAAAYALAHDKTTAIAEFMKPSGAFVRGDLYIFAYDFEGTVLCLPMEPGKIGDDRWDARDEQGDYYVREAVETARTSGSGWLRYTYANPSEGYQVQEKSSYVRKVGATWLIGAGTYRQVD
jgi:polar amino acid transport system substrate-binding protein